MGWDIYIGNAKPVKSEDSGVWWLTIDTIENESAPFWPNKPGTWGDISGKTNHRAPSYTGFGDFCRTTGIKVTAFTEAKGSDGDCYVLTAEDLASVTDARKRWEEAHPGAEPGWGEGQDYNLATMIWYEWWMKWALENCECPAIQMS